MPRIMLTDEHWSKLSSIMLKDRAITSPNIEILWKVFYIECEQDALGVMCQSHLVESVFARFKQYRDIATRYDKLKRNYESTLALACCMIWLPM